METVDVLLSDKFQEYAKNLADIAERKKRRKAEFKELYDGFLAEIRAMDQSAISAQKDFEEWKRSVATQATDS